MPDPEPAFSRRSRVSFAEYSMYYATTERVTEQRLAANRWNYSVCVALLVGIGLLVKFESGQQSYVIVALIGMLALCGLAIAFCRLWLSQIETLKALNGHKFSVLNEMAKRVHFEDAAGVETSYEPFQREWLRLEAAKQAVQIPGLNNSVALRSSDAELFVPKAFLWVFSGIAVLVLLCATVATSRPDTRSYVPFSLHPSTQAATTTSPSATPFPSGKSPR